MVHHPINNKKNLQHTNDTNTIATIRLVPVCPGKMEFLHHTSASSTTTTTTPSPRWKIIFQNFCFFCQRTVAFLLRDERKPLCNKGKSSTSETLSAQMLVVRRWFTRSQSCQQQRPDLRSWEDNLSRIDVTWKPAQGPDFPRPYKCSKTYTKWFIWMRQKIYGRTFQPKHRSITFWEWRSKKQPSWKEVDRTDLHTYTQPQTTAESHVSPVPGQPRFSGKRVPKGTDVSDKNQTQTHYITKN